MKNRKYDGKTDEEELTLPKTKTRQSGIWRRRIDDGLEDDTEDTKTKVESGFDEGGNKRTTDEDEERKIKVTKKVNIRRTTYLMTTTTTQDEDEDTTNIFGVWFKPSMLLHSPATAPKTWRSQVARLTGVFLM